MKTVSSRRRSLVVAGLALAFAAAGAVAAPDAQFQAAFATFMQASGGDKAAIEPAADAFAALLKAEPANPVLMAYAGAATAMRANTTLMPWKKMSYAEDGLALLDKALAVLDTSHDAPLQNGTPATLDVRFVAASTFLAVPGFMNRGPRGAKLLDEVLASPLLAAAPLRFRGSVWMRAAERAAHDKRADDARRLYAQVVQQGAPQAPRAEAALKGLGS